MVTCLICDEPLLGPVAIRIRQGCVRNFKWGTTIAETMGFRDGSTIKWVCKRCAIERCIFPNTLEDKTCFLCNKGFVSTLQPHADIVLLVEKCLLKPSTKGKRLAVKPLQGGHVHNDCAWKDWDLPLWKLQSRDIA